MSLAYINPVFIKQEEASEDELNESIYQDFIELADGSQKLDKIISTMLAKGHHITQIMKVLQTLHEKKQLKESADSELNSFTPDEINKLEAQLVALTAYGFDSGSLFLPFSESALKHQKRIKDANISIVGDKEIVQELVKRLDEIGVGKINVNIDADDALDADFSSTLSFVSLTTHEGSVAEFIQDIDADILIYLPKVFSEGEAIEINKRCYKRNIDFLPYQNVFPQVKIGPLHLCKESSCYHCYFIRKEGASFMGNKPTVPDSNFRSFNVLIGLDMICVEMIKYYSYYLDVSTKNNVWTFDINDCKSHLEVAFKLPRCPLCGISKLKPATKLWE